MDRESKMQGKQIINGRARCVDVLAAALRQPYTSDFVKHRWQNVKRTLDPADIVYTANGIPTCNAFPLAQMLVHMRDSISPNAYGQRLDMRNNINAYLASPAWTRLVEQLETAEDERARIQALLTAPPPQRRHPVVHRRPGQSLDASMAAAAAAAAAGAERGAGAGAPYSPTSSATNYRMPYFSASAGHGTLGPGGADMRSARAVLTHMLTARNRLGLNDDSSLEELILSLLNSGSDADILSLRRLHDCMRLVQEPNLEEDGKNSSEPPLVVTATIAHGQARAGTPPPSDGASTGHATTPRGNGKPAASALEQQVVDTLISFTSQAPPSVPPTTGSRKRGREEGDGGDKSSGEPSAKRTPRQKKKADKE